MPADIRLLEVTTRIECDEAVLTGRVDAGREVGGGGRTGRLRPSICGRAPSWAPSCTTAAGRGARRLDRDGERAFGKIAAGLSERETETAFQVGLRDFSGLLSKVAGVLSASIFIVNVAFSRPLIESLLFSLAIAIGITPQLLPAIVSREPVDRVAGASRASACSSSGS